MADVLAVRGIEALVFRGDDGLDELTTTTTSTVWRVRDGSVDVTLGRPGRLGIPPATADDLRGGEAAVNADVVRRLVAGNRGPVRDAVVLNAAAALAAHAGLTDDLDADLRPVWPPRTTRWQRPGGGAAGPLDRRLPAGRGGAPGLTSHRLRPGSGRRRRGLPAQPPMEKASSLSRLA